MGGVGFGGLRFMFFGLARFTLVLSDQKASFGGAPSLVVFPCPKTSNIGTCPTLITPQGSEKATLECTPEHYSIY